MPGLKRNASSWKYLINYEQQQCIYQYYASLPPTRAVGWIWILQSPIGYASRSLKNQGKGGKFDCQCFWLDIVSDQIPHHVAMGQGLASKQVKYSTYFPTQPGRGVVGYNIDRWLDLRKPSYHAHL